MNTHTLGIGIIVIIVVVGGFFFFTNKAEAPDSALPVNTADTSFYEEGGPVVESESDTMGTEDAPISLPNEGERVVSVVTYTDDGFSPAEIEIQKGDTVRFENKSSDRMWVGADIHPTHSLYPVKSSDDCLGSSFDQCRASVAGESWEFTFDEVGDWRYHNHTRASKRGTVTVK
ncbi:MAG: hypothetical protein WD153_03105 [Candidatus Paceibacterota bacterium]